LLRQAVRVVGDFLADCTKHLPDSATKRPTKAVLGLFSFPQEGENGLTLPELSQKWPTKSRFQKRPADPPSRFGVKTANEQESPSRN
jgi:hypothetical protein